MVKFARNAHLIYYNAFKRFFVKEYTYRASALAFTTLLSLVPLLFVIVFFTTAFPVFTKVMMLSEKYVIKNLVPEAAASMQYYFQGFIGQATNLPVLSIIFLFITAIMLINTIDETLNEIWQTPKRKFNIFSFALYWASPLLLPLFIGLSVLASTYIFSIAWIAKTTDMLGLRAFILSALPIFINTMIFCLIYIVIPNKKIKWRYGFSGAIHAAFLLELARFSFTFYLARYPSYALIYGAFAIIPIFLVWLYIFWFIVIIGALISHSQANLTRHA